MDHEQTPLNSQTTRSILPLPTLPHGISFRFRLLLFQLIESTALTIAYQHAGICKDAHLIESVVTATMYIRMRSRIGMTCRSLVVSLKFIS
jgi:hypothetical protein